MTNEQLGIDMKLLKLLTPLERSFFELIISQGNAADREVLKDQMGRINQVRRYDSPSNNETQTILYWHSWFRVRRDFPVIFPFARAEERLAEAVAVVSGERIRMAVWMLTGAIAWISHEPRMTTGAIEVPKFDLFRLFPDRERNIETDESFSPELTVSR